jgi:cellulose synthase (UDP-forming)
VAEDFHTTIRLHGQGWHTKYHDEILVQGLAPHDLASFLLQRDRWARGNLAVLRTRENPVVAPGLTLKQRASYLASLLAYFVPLQRLAMLAVLVAMLVTGALPLHATAWQFGVFWLPWMILNLVASAALCRGQASLWDGAYSTHLTGEIFTRAVLALVHPFRASFKVTPKDGIDDGGWSAVRQLRLVVATGAVLVGAVVVRCLGMAGVIILPPLRGLAVVAGLVFAVWELTLIGAALWKVSRRHQFRHHYRVPVEMAGVISGTLVRVVDLTPGGAGIIAPGPVEVGSTFTLHLDLTDVHGVAHGTEVFFTVRSCRPAPDLGWRMGGTLTPVGEVDGERLIEHCHVVSSRARLMEAGHLSPGDPHTSPGDPNTAVPGTESESLSAHG